MGTGDDAACLACGYVPPQAYGYQGADEWLALVNEPLRRPERLPTKISNWGADDDEEDDEDDDLGAPAGPATLAEELALLSRRRAGR